MDSDHEYHLNRAAAELALAEQLPDGAAEAHRQLAELHRARGETHRFIERLSARTLSNPRFPIRGTDKEA